MSAEHLYPRTSLISNHGDQRECQLQDLYLCLDGGHWLAQHCHNQVKTNLC